MRFKLTLHYRGTRFHGWQTQPKHITVQSLVEAAIARIARRRVHVQAASRTDAGVHAMGQVCHFDLKSDEVSDKNGIPFCERLRHGLNSILPDDISAVRLEKVSDSFHATDHARLKTYDYYLFLSRIRCPFVSSWTWRIPYPIELSLMRAAAKDLIGRHDFTSFCAADSSAKTTVRDLKRVTILSMTKPVLPFGSVDLASGKIVRIRCEGAGFLKHMVRNIVGTLIYVGRGAMKASDMKRILKSKDRRAAGPTAPPEGLFLMKVKY